MDVEHAFSCGGLIFSKLRHSLSDSSACAATILASWSKLEGVIPKVTIIDLFKNKYKCLKKKKKMARLSLMVA